MVAAAAWEMRKHCRMQQQKQRSTDRISKLPDGILGQILSSVPSTKDAVKTSILSKRWRIVWTYVHAVKVSDRDYFTGYNFSETDHDAEKAKSAFMSCVDKVVALSSLRKIGIRCSYVYDISRVKQWIHNIITNLLRNDYAHVKELDLKFASLKQQPVQLPPSIFTSKNLVVLKLSFNVEINLPSSSVAASASLPSLKVLYLCPMETGMDVSSVENILTCCPILEELFLQGYMHDRFNKERLCINSSSSLKRLTLYSYSRGIRGAMLTFEIDACNLEKLVLALDLQNPIIIANTSLPLLTRVSLDLCNFQPKFKDVGGNSLIELLRKVATASSINYLHLSFDAIMSLDYGGFYQQVPMLTNLMHLQLSAFSSTLPILPCLLKNSPNLASFSLATCNFLRLRELQSHITPNCFLTMTTMLNHLDKVELSSYEGCDHEMELVTYFLKNAPALKKMILVFESQVEKKEASLLYNRILKLPKASIACEVICQFMTNSKSGHLIP